MQHGNTEKSENHGLLLVLFWAYVLIPLGWGVFETFKKALALFHLHATLRLGENADRYRVSRHRVGRTVAR